MEQQSIGYYLALAEEADCKLSGAEQGAWLSRLEAEREQLLTALTTSMESGGDDVTTLRLCGALLSFWRVRGYIAEGRQWCEAVLKLAGAQEATAERAKVLNGAGTLARMQGDFGVAQAYHEESLAIHDALGDKKGSAASLNGLGNLASSQGDYAAARQRYERSLAIKRELGDKAVIAGSLNNLGYLAYLQGDTPTARCHYVESLNLRREAGPLSLQETLTLLQGLAEVATADNQQERGACLYGAIKGLCERPEGKMLTLDEKAFATDIATLRDALSEVEFAAAFAQGAAMTLEQAIEYALITE
ncbi:hypothetical protein LBMAG21_09990 [Armatimonadota bacterium]|nr:hypothetical protein LBMAG21_09990 [Armatimonadota bacterium]